MQKPNLRKPTRRTRFLETLKNAKNMMSSVQTGDNTKTAGRAGLTGVNTSPNTEADSRDRPIILISVISETHSAAEEAGFLISLKRSLAEAVWADLQTRQGSGLKGNPKVKICLQSSRLH